jgi:aquaporin PIP
MLEMKVMAATDSIRAETNKHISTVAPLVIGLAVTVSHFTAIPVDNCSINPARSFGVAAISGNWNDHWVFWFGPYLGATAAALCYTYLFQVSLSFCIRRFMFPYFYQVLMLTDLIEKI